MKSSEYKAREAYRDKHIVTDYDSIRFKSIKGRFTNSMELGVIKNALESINILTGGRVLDIPCGTGRLSFYLASRGYCVTGADISEEMVNSSAGKSLSMSQNIRPHFVVTEAEKLHFTDNSFDAVVSLRLFGHVPPSIRTLMLNEFSRVTSSYLVIAYYHASSIQCILRRRTRGLRGVPWYPVSYQDIKTEIENAGLTLVNIKPILLGISETLAVVAKKRDTRINQSL